MRFKTAQGLTDGEERKLRFAKILKNRENIGKLKFALLSFTRHLKPVTLKLTKHLEGFAFGSYICLARDFVKEFLTSGKNYRIRTDGVPTS